MICVLCILCMSLDITNSKGGFIVPVLKVRVLSNTNELVRARQFPKNCRGASTTVQKRTEKCKRACSLCGCSLTFLRKWASPCQFFWVTWTHFTFNTGTMKPPFKVFPSWTLSTWVLFLLQQLSGSESPLTKLNKTSWGWAVPSSA